MQSRIVLLAQAVPEGRVFGLDSQTVIGIVIQLINAIILAVALGFILYKPVKEFMDKRSKGIQGKIDDADETMEKANELIAEYDEKIKNIDKERLEILEEARISATNEKNVILAEAQREADEIKKRASEGISADKKRLKEESQLYIIDIASLMAKKHIGKSIDDETQDELFKESLAQLEETDWQN